MKRFLKELVKFREGKFETHFIPKEALVWDKIMEVYRVKLPALPDSTMFSLDNFLAKVVDQEVIICEKCGWYRPVNENWGECNQDSCMEKTCYRPSYFCGRAIPKKEAPNA